MALRGRGLEMLGQSIIAGSQQLGQGIGEAIDNKRFEKKFGYSKSELEGMSQLANINQSKAMTEHAKAQTQTTQLTNEQKNVELDREAAAQKRLTKVKDLFNSLNETGDTNIGISGGIKIAENELLEYNDIPAVNNFLTALRTNVKNEQEMNFAVSDREDKQEFTAEENQKDRESRERIAMANNTLSMLRMQGEERRGSRDTYEQIHKTNKALEKDVVQAQTLTTINDSMIKLGLGGISEESKGGAGLIGIGSKYIRDILMSDDPTYSDLRSSLRQMESKTLNKMSGAAISKEEFTRISKMLGLNARSSVADFKASMRRETEQTHQKFKNYEFALQGEAKTQWEQGVASGELIGSKTIERLLIQNTNDSEYNRIMSRYGTKQK